MPGAGRGGRSYYFLGAVSVLHYFVDRWMIIAQQYESILNTFYVDSHLKMVKITDFMSCGFFLTTIKNR